VCGGGGGASGRNLRCGQSPPQARTTGAEGLGFYH